jgi:hypothetical protein
MLGQAVGVSKGEAKRVVHYFNFVRTEIRRFNIVLVCSNSCFILSFGS